MKRWYIIIIFLISSYFFLSDVELDYFITGAVVSIESDTYIQDTGNISAYFCPGNCDTVLINEINKAQEYLDCAFYELDYPSIQHAIISQNVQKRIIVNDLNKKEFNKPYVKTDTWGLMHNKFCVIDGKTVTTGSMNPTTNGVTKNNNNLVIINSELVAQQYQDEFDEMWNGTFKKGNPVTNPEIKVGKSLLEVYFCPEDRCTDRVKEELKKAKKEIYFMTFSFTHEEIGNILLLKHTDGVTVKGVMEARQVTKFSEFERLKFQGIDVVKDVNKQNMHHKVFIIDNTTVITGSFNPTEGGDTRNDENIVIIKDADVAKLFLEEFEKVFSKNVTQT